jgi:hypothetical protein
MEIIKIYLAHYNSVIFFEKQVSLIKKFFKLNIGEQLQIHGFVDSPNEATRILMKKKWVELGVIPIELPSNRHSDPSHSYGLAFQFIYDNYIIHDTYISVFLENDIFPIADINLKEITDLYGLTTDIRFYSRYIPKNRVCQSWIGLQIFNHKYFKDKQFYSGLAGTITILDGQKITTDVGGHSYYWYNLNENWKTVKHINPIGQDPNYNPFTANVCEVHQIVNSINLPEKLRKGYMPDFNVTNYGNIFIHLVSIYRDQTKKLNESKMQWLDRMYNTLME